MRTPNTTTTLIRSLETHLEKNAARWNVQEQERAWKDTNVHKSA